MELLNTIYFYMFPISIAIFALEGLIQIYVTTRFIYKTRNIKELSGWWLKLMSFLPNVTWICYIILWVYWMDKKLAGVVQAIISLTAKFSLVIMFGYLIRMIRVQVQLKAEKENTKQIIKAIEQSKWVEGVGKLFLVMFQVSIAGYYVVILAFPKYPVLTGVVNTVGGFSLIIFTNVFCY